MMASTLKTHVGPLRLYRVLVIACYAALTLQGQTAASSLSGTVRDPSEASIPEVAIKIVNSGTNESRTTTTNTLGYYSFPLLPPATYRLEAEAAGFKRFGDEASAAV